VALDGSEEEVGSSADAQHAALVALLTEALSAQAAAAPQAPPTPFAEGFGDAD
jgi:hypothetical protein